MIMGPDDPIISPIPGKGLNSIGARCAMVGHPMDVEAVCAQDERNPKSARRFLLGRLHHSPDPPPGYSVVGPLIGAPYAVMMLETIIAWGVRQVVFFGWCGAVSSKVHIGDIIVPDAALIDEGTSRHYASPNIYESRPSPDIQDVLKHRLSEKKIPFHQGAVWTTDAIFRETPQKVSRYQEAGALCVDMETSALFSAGRFRKIPVGCILVVSDEVSAMQWVQGFASPKFKESRQHAGAIVCNFLKNRNSADPL